jgi:hypothetical protein
VRDWLTLSKLRVEHPMLTMLIDLIQVKKKHEKQTLACMGDTIPASRVWFHHNLAGFSNCNNDSCFFSVITPIMMALTHCYTILGTDLVFFTMIFAVFEERSIKRLLTFSSAKRF